MKGTFHFFQDPIDRVNLVFRFRNGPTDYKMG
jgi:hypothetical protein